jgi:adenylosuccinate synthase
MRRSAKLNSLSGLCLTKLDVLDGLERIGICTGYKYRGTEIHTVPIGAENYAQCEPIIEELPGWKGSTAGLKAFDDLPANAKTYVARIQELIEVPVDILSTGADRNETIIIRHPFD